MPKGRAAVYHGKKSVTKGGLRKGDLVKKKGRIISRKKQKLGQKSKALKAWREAARAMGYLHRGAEFKKLPKKGTEAYEALKEAYLRRLRAKK